MPKIYHFALFLLLVGQQTLLAEYYYRYDKKEVLKPLSDHSVLPKSLDRSSSRVYFENTKGNWLGVDGKIFIQFNAISKKQKEAILDKYNVTKLQEYTDTLWLVYTKNINNTLMTANKLHQLSSIKYAQPDFSRHMQNRSRSFEPLAPTDPLFEKTWHLQKQPFYPASPAFDIAEIFKTTQGRYSTIGIVDDGLDVYHEDLRINVRTYVNADSLQSNPKINLFSDTHGTKMAGILIAAQNDKGSMGIAPRAKLHFARHQLSRETFVASEIINAYSYLLERGVSVISNSWGTHERSQVLEDYINYIVKNARDGKGVVIVFATGNSAINLDDKDISDESEMSSVIGVGSVNRAGNAISTFSDYGKELDIFTAGENIVTTFVSGFTNLESFGYGYAKGASASAAITSGVIGLMFTVNPNMTASEVRNIILSSARDTFVAHGHRFRILRPEVAIDYSLVKQTLDDVRDQVLASPIRRAIGEFAYFDFDNSPAYFDFVFRQDGQHYKLHTPSGTPENVFGFAQINAPSNLNYRFLLLSRFGVDNFSSKHWLLVDKISSLTYLIHFNEDYLRYEKLDLIATVNDYEVIFAKASR